VTVIFVLILITYVHYKCADEFVGSHGRAHHQGDSEAVNEQTVHQQGHVLHELGWSESSEVSFSASSCMPSDHWYDVFLWNMLCMCFVRSIGNEILHIGVVRGAVGAPAPSGWRKK